MSIKAADYGGFFMGYDFSVIVRAKIITGFLSLYFNRLAAKNVCSVIKVIVLQRFRIEVQFLLIL